MKNIQLTDFFINLAHKPYCSDELLYGLKIRPKTTAIKMQYIQGNQPCMLHYFFFDIDRSEAVMAWHDKNLPMPYWTAQNPRNGHAHICYKLEIPLCTSEFGSQKAIAYASKVQAGLASKLGADVGYSHLITKNPFHQDWRIEFWSEKSYTLDYLADFVDIPNKLSKKQEQLGLGRNCTLFNTVRKWAYKAIRGHRGGIYSKWYAEVFERCQSSNNAFLEPLSDSEIKATAKSIAEYCWKKDAYCYQEFIDRQSRKGKLGSNKANNIKNSCVLGGKAKSRKYDQLRIDARKLYDNGYTKSSIAIMLGVSRQAIYNWLNIKN
ncbi:replication initiation protein [Acinetobacter sp. B5B]|uniref:replication initiation protein n=1 Tax=Acinetobacter baretiae TaxID=2605383 RepID=UPI0018C1F79A|nr:replication initiation protein [Acinetobacter baretiae]